MAIQLKRSATTGNKPSSLVTGEVAINEADALLFHRSPSGLITPIGLREQLSRMNMAINGGMQVDQERAGNSVTGVTATTKYIADCTRFSSAGAVAATLQQVADAPTGFTNSAKVTVTTADNSIATTDYAVLGTFVEGYDAAKLGWGAAGAKPISIGFWVKANRTAASGSYYSGSVSNSAANRSYPFTFEISSAGTWEYKTVTVPGDTIGTWNTTNGAGLNLYFALMAGSNFTGTANTWAGSNYYGVTSTVNGVAATSDYMQITGVSIVEGNTPIPSDLSRYSYLTFEAELAGCRRYYYKSYSYSVVPGAVASEGTRRFCLDGISSAAHTVIVNQPFEKETRANPTVTVYSSETGASGKLYDAAMAGDITASVSNTGTKGFSVSTTQTSAATYVNMSWHFVADARL